MSEQLTGHRAEVFNKLYKEFRYAHPYADDAVWRSMAYHVETKINSIWDLPIKDLLADWKVGA